MSLSGRVLTHFNVVNLVLSVATILLYAVGVHPILTADPVRLSLQGVKALPIPSIPQMSGEASGTADRRVPPVLDYVAVSEHNLFHSTRKIPPGTGKREQQAARPDLVLHGTLIADGLQVAYVSDRRVPKTSPGRGERQSVLKKGDVLSGYVVSEIAADRIVLVKGDDKLVVPLDSPGKRRSAVAAPWPVSPSGRPPFDQVQSAGSSFGSKVLRREKSGTP